MTLLQPFSLSERVCFGSQIDLLGDSLSAVTPSELFERYSRAITALLILQVF